jgi:hypothetical protein
MSPASDQMPFPAAFAFNAGVSTCPICKRQWTVTPADDCILPECGCYGHEPALGDRPCEACGTAHQCEFRSQDERGIG